MAKMECEECKGKGLVPHERRKINNEFDPWDFQKEELCMKCGGVGKTEYRDPEKIQTADPSVAMVDGYSYIFGDSALRGHDGKPAMVCNDRHDFRGTGVCWKCGYVPDWG